MDNLIENQKNFIEQSFQSAFGNEALLFQIVDFFPMPIEIFAPDGTSIFLNRAFLEVFNISVPGQIIGRLNILQDPYANDELGLREYLKRVFEGETLSVSDIKVPFNEMTVRYEAKNNQFDIDSMYQNITCFPICDQNNEMAYIVAVFITTRIYQGQSDIARAKEYIETHWLEEFDMDKTSQSANLSRYHFARLFKKHTSPYSYYQDVKVRKVKEMLCDKNLSITEAFAACGVDYNGNYAKIFREKIGMTPSQYRETVSQK